jgi:uncharacterized protein (TIGR02444 family)
MARPRSSFWEFSLAVYSKPEVPEACLELQDKFSADVNVLLFMLWAADQGRRLDAQDISKVAGLVTDWQNEVVRPLRLTRRFLKSPAAAWQLEEVTALRQRIKANELEAERVQQTVMANFFYGDTIGQPDEFDPAVQFNIKTYAALLGVVFPDETVSLLMKSARHAT